MGAWVLRALPLVLCLIATARVANAGDPGPPAPGWHTEQIFDRYSPLASKWELATRTLAPTTVARLQQFEAQSETNAAEHTIDLAKERFDLFIPENRPAAGYGLIVFVAPMPVWSLSTRWRSELEKRGFVFVVARNAGNWVSAYERRLPLALHAYESVRHRLPIDPSRVFAAGFSGGGRLALRLALSYPDVFDGVLVLAGSQPFGASGLFGEPWMPPPAEYMNRVRRDLRVVFVSGMQDLPNRAHDADSAESWRAYCVAGLSVMRIPRTDHWVPEGRYVARVLDELEAPAPPRPDTEACIDAMQARIEQALAQVEATLDAGQPREAGALLGELEDRYGGLAAPRTVELARRIAAALGTDDSGRR